MKIDEMKKKLKTTKKITFSKHFNEPKVRLRGITEEDVRSYLEDPKKLEIVENQEHEPKGHKYGLLFRKSNKYDLKIVISIKGDSINVITSYVQNKKRRKVFEKWLRKLK